MPFTIVLFLHSDTQNKEAPLESTFRPKIYELASANHHLEIADRYLVYVAIQ